MHIPIVKYTKDLPEYKKKPKKVFKKNGKLKRKFYEKEMLKLHHELVKLQEWTMKNQERLLMLYEGLDAAGKTSTIKETMRYLSPRHARYVALPKPSDYEKTQWYFQRYIKQFPAGGEMVFFDRSWYNRAGVEMVFGFCTPQQHQLFYRQVNEVEELLVNDEIYFFKFYLTISKETQAKRLREREKNPLKRWKLSELDYKGHEKYDEYVKLRDKMFTLSGTFYAPWCELDANDKKRAKLNAVRFLLYNIEYDGKNTELVTGVDEKIVTLHNKII